MEKIIDTFFKNERKVIGTLVLIPFLLYLRSLWYDFSPMDDQWLILKNVAFFEKWKNIKAVFSEPTSGLYYRPLLLLSFMIDLHIGHVSPMAYHFTNLLLHITCVVLLYKFLILSGTSKKIAFSGSVVFSIHPLMLHSVAWIPGRNDLLLCVFTLAAFICLIKYLHNRKTKYLCVHLLFFICALFTKENAIMLPLVFIAIYYFESHNKFKGAALIAILWALLSISWIMLRKSIVTTPALFDKELISGTINSFNAFLVYIGKAIIPLQLSVFPTLNNSSLFPGIVALVILIVVCYRIGIHNKKNAGLGVFIFFGILLMPVWFGANSSSGEHYEHRAYTSMVGLILFVSALNFNANSKWFSYAFIGIMLFFGTLTLKRMSVYKTQLSFLDSGIASEPGYYLFYIQKGSYLYDKKEYALALPFFNKGIELRPNIAEALNLRGKCYSILGNNKEAVKDFSKAIETSEFDPGMYLNRCISYNYLNETDKAMADLMVLRKCCVSMIPAELNEAVTKKWIDNSIAKIDRQLLANSNNPTLYYYRAKLFSDKGEKSSALRDIEKACELDPNNIEYKKFLSQLNQTLH